LVTFVLFFPLFNQTQKQLLASKQPDKVCLAGDCLIEILGHLLSRTADIAQRNRLQRLFAMYYLNKMTPTQFKIQLPFGFDSLAIKPGSTSVSQRTAMARALLFHNIMCLLQSRLTKKYRKLLISYHSILFKVY
jgi:hypothetical protein